MLSIGLLTGFWFRDKNIAHPKFICNYTQNPLTDKGERIKYEKTKKRLFYFLINPL